MTAASARTARGRHVARGATRRSGGPVVRGGARRRLVVLAELLVAVGVCLTGYEWCAAWMQRHEAAWVVGVLRLAGVDGVSAVLPGHILMFRAGGEMLDGEVTTSCSSILTVVGLTALTIAVMRSRRLHAVWGLLVALVAVVIANDLRLMASSMAGIWWGRPAMVLFHDWVGTVWTLAATLGGFLLMVCITLPTAVRAEQDVAGRHTARRPDGWAQPGLGYRAGEPQARGGGRRRTLTGLVHRYLLPRGVSRRLAARREAGRIDYRIGHLPTAERAAKVRALVADGLGAHTASLLAVAAHEQDPAVLDALAEAIAARQWEPVTNDRVAGLRLWARGWLFRVDDTRSVAPLRSRPPVPAPAPRPAPPHPVPSAVVRQVPPPASPAEPVAPGRHRPVRTAPRTFARPAGSTGTPPVEETP